MRRSHHPRFAHPVLLAILLAMLLTAPGAAAAPADDVAAFLPPGVDYDPEVPSPAAVLGIRLGEWHLRHDQVVHYIEALAAASPRLTAETIGHSHEQRRLLLVTATDPAQHDRLDALREAHRRGDDDAPIVVWLGYGVHGDEASATHAAVVMLYHLAAARDEATRTLLREAIIIVDPCLNPDGHDRFTTWVNMHRGRQTVGDPQHREHRQGWPTGRTNHYWFDLNRDWLPVQHPESQARVAAFQRWKPHLLTDVHEMGRNSTYFFQPGVPSRQNPRTPASNIELTRRIAAYHAEALDTLGQLYYSEEIFDDYYYGKGSTYPDAQGSIGILFEQASARGHVQDTPDGPLTFATAIRNQVATSFSTLRAAYALQDDLRRYRADSQASAARAAAADPVKAFAFGDRRDPRRAAALADLIRRHDIAVYPLTADLALADDRRIDGGLTDDGQPAGYVVPLDQPQYRLIHALFEIHTAFEDTTFYDVSTWTMPLALHVPYAALDARAFAAARFDRDARVDADPAAPSDARPLAPATRDAAGRPVVAYALPWDGLEAPRALQRLHRLGARIRMATAPFTGVIHPGAAADAADSADADADATRAFAPGTLVVPLAVQTIDPDALHRTLETIAREDGLPVATLASGLTPGGIDLGSPSFVRLDAPRVALVVDRPINMYSAGSLWHLLDWRVGLPVTLLRADALPRADLDRYTHIVLPDGRYSWLADGDALGERLARWTDGGGVLIAVRGATSWVDRRVLAPRGGESAKGDRGSATAADDPAPARQPYGDYRALRDARVLGGAILDADVDLTHPLAYGVRDTPLPVFRRGAEPLPPHPDPFGVVAAYAAEPVRSGYAHPEVAARLAGTPSMTAQRSGGGLVVRLADAPAFRGFFRGAERLLVNAVYFSAAVQPTRALDGAAQ